MFGEFDSDGASSTGVKEKVENSFKIQFFSKKCEKMHILNFRAVKKIIVHLKNFWECKKQFQICFKIQNLHKHRVFWYRPISGRIGRCPDIGRFPGHIAIWCFKSVPVFQRSARAFIWWVCRLPISHSDHFKLISTFQFKMHQRQPKYQQNRWMKIANFHTWSIMIFANHFIAT